VEARVLVEVQGACPSTGLSARAADAASGGRRIREAVACAESELWLIVCCDCHAKLMRSSTKANDHHPNRPTCQPRQTLTPLLNEKKETVMSCTLTVAIDPATGILSTTEQKGSSVAESWSSFWTYIQFGLVLMLPFLLIASYYIYSYCHDLYVNWQHAVWLTAFYQQNAPQVSDSILVLSSCIYCIECVTY